jgi:hypothetical protein
VFWLHWFITSISGHSSYISSGLVDSGASL